MKYFYFFIKKTTPETVCIVYLILCHACSSPITWLRVHFVYSTFSFISKKPLKSVGPNSWKLREMCSDGRGIIGTQCCRPFGRYFQISGEMKSIVMVTEATAGRGPHFQCLPVTRTSIMYGFHLWNVLSMRHATCQIKAFSLVFLIPYLLYLLEVFQCNSCTKKKSNSVGFSLMVTSTKGNVELLIYKSDI